MPKSPLAASVVPNDGSVAAIDRRSRIRKPLSIRLELRVSLMVVPIVEIVITPLAPIATARHANTTRCQRVPVNNSSPIRKVRKAAIAVGAAHRNVRAAG